MAPKFAGKRGAEPLATSPKAPSPTLARKAELTAELWFEFVPFGKNAALALDDFSETRKPLG
ncbi:unnamed protein product, partial [Symbiodinium pilosum]